MIISTTDQLQGSEIKEYIGLVSVRVPNEKGNIDKAAAETVEKASDALKSAARETGADAVIGVRIIPETLSVFAVGTAVKLG